MGRGRDVRALTANVKKELSDAVANHCGRLGVPVTKWLGSAAELNLKLDSGELALFDVTIEQLNERKRWAEEWAQIGDPGNLSDECRRLLWESVQNASGFMVIPEVEFWMFHLGSYNTQQQFRANAEEAERRNKKWAGIWDQLVKAVTDVACEHVLAVLTQAHELRAENRVLRRQLARYEEPRGLDAA